LKLSKDKSFLIGVSGWLVLLLVILITLFIGKANMNVSKIMEMVVIVWFISFLALIIILFFSFASLSVVLGQLRTMKGLLQDKEVTLEEYKLIKRNGVLCLIINGSLIIVAVSFLIWFLVRMYEVAMGV
jgi:hypothetical protein